MKNLRTFPGNRIIWHAVIVGIVWLLLLLLNNNIDPLYSSYLALVAMYATAMFGMTILVGLSGQVSLGNGALMAVGGYVFALTSMNWQTVPIIGWQWNAVWSMVFSGLGGILIGGIVGGLAARLRGPYLAGLTLGLAVGVPAITNRFPELLGGENGLMLSVPYPAGGYAALDSALGSSSDSSSGATVDPNSAVEEDQYAELDLSEFEQGANPDADLAPEDLLTDGDLLTEEDFGVGDQLTDGDLLTEEDFGVGDQLTDGDLLTDEDFGTGTDLAVDPTGITDAFDSGFIIERWQASMAIAVACLVAFAALNLVRGRQGRVWKAVRDDPVAAAVVGISPSGSKISAFVVSSLFAALAGAVFAQILSFIGPGAFGLGLSLSLLVGIVLGGRSSLLGAILGALLLVWLPELVDGLSGDRGWPEQITNNAPNLLYGLLVVAVVLAAPGGVTGTVRAWVDKARGKTRSPLS
ncbi:MAG: branched-chain amino acid ABC transporter permease [Candidatus Nanopelagicales bacterium]|nr:branched-chain amino acid ABC transporter permease [Candidatus Nanopelagicales bacterium]